MQCPAANRQACCEGHLESLQLVGRSRGQLVELDRAYVVERLTVNGQQYVYRQVRPALYIPAGVASTACTPRCGEQYVYRQVWPALHEPAARQVGSAVHVPAGVVSSTCTSKCDLPYVYHQVWSAIEYWPVRTAARALPGATDSMCTARCGQ